jgi:hypothetical protein
MAAISGRPDAGLADDGPPHTVRRARGPTGRDRGMVPIQPAARVRALMKPVRRRLEGYGVDLDAATVAREDVVEVRSRAANRGLCRRRRIGRERRRDAECESAYR